MRQIKFRGLTEGGTCVYGDLINYKNGRKAIIGRQLSAPGYLSVEGARISPVKAETVGQYTGLKDVNGVEIYEDDIVEFSSHWDKHVCTVSFDKCKFGFGREIKGELGINHHCTLLSFMRGSGCNGYTVIGNIHQNPELLEGDK